MQWLAVLLAWLLLGGMILLLRPDQFTFSGLSSVRLGDSITLIAVTLGFMLLMPLAILFAVEAMLPSKSRWLGSRTLRAVVFAGESKQLPAVLDQPAPLAANELSQDMGSFRFLKAQPRTSNFFILLIAFYMLLLVIILALSLELWKMDPSPDLVPGPHGLYSATDLLQIIVVILSMGRFSTVSGRPHVIAEGWGTLLPARQPRLLGVDDWGIRWRARGWRTHEYTLAWHDIAVFCVYHQKADAGAKVSYTYIAMSSDLSFSWILPHRHKAVIREASERLSRLVVTRTGRPLLDVTQSITALGMWSAAATNPRAIQWRRQIVEQLAAFQENRKTRSSIEETAQGLFGEMFEELAVAEDMAPLHRSTIEEIDRFASPVRPIRMRARFYVLNILLILLVSVGVYGTWQVNQQHADEYYRTLPGRIAAETPLYSDSLVSVIYAWPRQKPTATDSTSYQYAYGGYAITGGPTGSTTEVIQEAQYVDLAVAVTARQIGSSDNDGVGLIARSFPPDDNESDAIIFTISPSAGFWGLAHYQPGHKNPDDNWNFLDGGNSSAIQTSAGAANRLLLVVRGTEYLCYINGQLVGRDVDSTVTRSSPRFGSSGLFLNDNTTVGVFNDFAIYEAPPPYQPLFHGL